MEEGWRRGGRSARTHLRRRCVARDERIREPAPSLLWNLCSVAGKPHVSSPVFARDDETNEYSMNSPRLTPPETEANKFRLLEDNVSLATSDCLFIVYVV